MQTFKFRRFLFNNGWQFNCGSLQLNWTSKSKEYLRLPWGLRVFYANKFIIDIGTSYKY